ncbi:MAG: hypothetical protein AAGA93_12715 [Actinomycetota bacterium]
MSTSNVEPAARTADLARYPDAADARAWSRFEPSLAERMLRPVAWWADVFSSPVFRERGRADDVTWAGSDDGRAAWARLRERLTTGV